MRLFLSAGSNNRYIVYTVYIAAYIQNMTRLFTFSTVCKTYVEVFFPFNVQHCTISISNRREAPV